MFTNPPNTTYKLLWNLDRKMEALRLVGDAIANILNLIIQSCSTDYF
jgi:hypothetical protein